MGNTHAYRKVIVCRRELLEGRFTFYGHESVLCTPLSAERTQDRARSIPIGQRHGDPPATVRQVVADTEAFSVRVEADDAGMLRQVVDRLVDWPLPVMDLRGAADPWAQAQEWMRADLRRPFDLRRAPPVQLHGAAAGHRPVTLVPM